MHMSMRDAGSVRRRPPPALPPYEVLSRHHAEAGDSSKCTQDCAHELHMPVKRSPQSHQRQQLLHFACK